MSGEEWTSHAVGWLLLRYLSARQLAATKLSPLLESLTNTSAQHIRSRTHVSTRRHHSHVRRLTLAL